MRPIDADLLQERVHDMFQNVRGHRLVMDIVKQTEEVISELIAEQEMLPEGREQKKGKWRKTTMCGVKAIRCSQCVTYVPDLFGWMYTYCPNCGTRMEGADEGDEND